MITKDSSLDSIVSSSIILPVVFGIWFSRYWLQTIYKLCSGQMAVKQLVEVYLNAFSQCTGIKCVFHNSIFFFGDIKCVIIQMPWGDGTGRTGFNPISKTCEPLRWKLRYVFFLCSSSWPDVYQSLDQERGRHNLDKFRHPECHQNRWSSFIVFRNRVELPRCRFLKLQ